MARRALVLGIIGVGACAGSASPPVAPDNTEAHAPPAPAPANHCPLVDSTAARPWLSELFPSCPTAPFGTILSVCAGEACPRPCAAIVEATGMRPGWGGSRKFQYDEHGRWTRTNWDDGEVDECTGDACVLRGDASRVTRDAAGRITAIVAGDDRHEVRRDEHGRVAAIGGQTFTYDFEGQLIAAGAAKVAYDDDGRAIRVDDGDRHYAFGYDERDRVVRFQRVGDPHRTTVGYDDTGRPASLGSLGAMEDDGSRTTFHYDPACKPE